MVVSYRKLINLVPDELLPADLPTGIMEKIERYETGRLRRHYAVHIVCGLGAIAGFVPAVRYMLDGIRQSGFSEYASLIISDSAYVFSHLREFALSLAGSVPITAVIIAVALFTIFVNSLFRIAYYYRYYRSAVRLSPHPIR
jgi:hypothetical protein